MNFVGEPEEGLKRYECKGEVLTKIQKAIKHNEKVDNLDIKGADLSLLDLSGIVDDSCHLIRWGYW